MFTPQIAKFSLWNMAQHLDPRTGVFGVRVSSTTPGTADTFVNYNLQRLTYRYLTTEELLFVKAASPDPWRVWMVTQFDLDTATPTPAPTPQIAHILTFTDGTVWTMERVEGKAMNQAWECICHREPLTA